MEDYLPSKTEVANKLQREMENLAVLQDSIQRSDLMTQNMLTILNSFENRLSKLEETINPIYQETGNLQRRHENIERTLAALNHVIDFYHVADEVEPIIRDGPSSGLDSYLQCMDKLQKAVQYLTANHSGSQEMAQVISLFDAGKDAMEKEFRNLLSRHGKPVSVDTMMDVLEAEDDDIEMEIPLSEHLPEKIIAELKQISAWLLSCKSDTFLQDYVVIRSGLLLKSLNALKEKMKADCKDTSSVSGLSHSPAPGMKQKLRETPVRKPSKRLAFVRKASSALKKSSNTLEPPGPIRHTGSSSMMKDETCEVDTESYICSVLALIKLIKSETMLMQGIIPEKQQRQIFEQLIQGALDQVVKDGEQICQYVKKATTRHNVVAVILLFPVLRQLRTVKPEFEKTLEGCLAPTRSRMASLISMLDSTGAKALEEFVDSIRNDPERQSNMPKDGTVHELTSNTMLFLEQLLDFCDTAGAMLLTQDPTSLPNVQNMDRPKLKLAEYITKVLSSLGLNLNNKAEAYNDPAIKSIFLLNNFNYILRSLRRPLAEMTTAIQQLSNSFPWVALLYNQPPCQLRGLHTYDAEAKVVLANSQITIISKIKRRKIGQVMLHGQSILEMSSQENVSKLIMKAKAFLNITRLAKSGMLDIVHLWNNEVQVFYEGQIVNQKRIYSQRTSILAIVQLRMPEIEDRYSDLLQQQKSNYVQSWSRVLHYISENQKPISASGVSPDAKLKEKDRNLIKEKFTGFNKEMEEIFRLQKAFAIPDTELRECLREDNLNFIMPFYSAFLKRYQGTSFTKNPDKYIKYREADVRKFIQGFFDAAA